MIPTTISGIVVLLVLLLPGFVFVTLRERHQPSRKQSVLRETSTVLAATTAAYALPAITTIVIAVFNELVRVNVAAFVSSPTMYGQQHPFRLTGVAACWVLAASIIAGVLSARWMNKYIPSRGGSGWWQLFDVTIPNLESIRVTATLDDDTVLTGTLHSWNRDAEDHPDRELVLQAPIWVQLAESATQYESDAATLTVSARNIKYLTARYLVNSPSVETSSGPTAL